MKDLKSVEEAVVNIYMRNGFVSEDELFDLCNDFNLELNEIDTVCDRLLSQKIIIRDSNFDKNLEIDTKEVVLSNVDRSHINYDQLLEKIKHEYPEMKSYIESISGITPPQTREWKVLISSARQGNIFAKDRLIYMYLRTVLKQAYVFAKAYDSDLEEMFQCGVIGLINAIDKYDENNPETFASYFPLWVRQYMQREAKINNTLFYFPSHYKDKLLSLINIIQRYRGEREDVEDVLRIIDKDELVLVEANEDNLIEYMFYLMPAIELTEDIVSYNNIDEKINIYFHKNIIMNLAQYLNKREVEVIRLRYGLIDDRQETLEEVGQILNLTRERIRQIEAKAFKKMRTGLQKMHIECSDIL